MKKDDYLQIFQENHKIILQKIGLWVQLSVPTAQWTQTYIRRGKGMAKSG